MHNAPPVYFQIRFTRHVVFKDWNGKITHEYNVGDTIQASHDNGMYYVTGVGGIYHNEAARVVTDDEMFRIQRNY